MLYLRSLELPPNVARALSPDPEPSMRLSDLVDQTELRLTMLTGGQSLDRPVRQVYTTDLLDPGRYLSGGELVLTGLMWRRRPADSERFAAAVARAGVSAVGAGEAAFGCVPPDLVDACDRHGVALLGVPVEVSFQTISDRVGAVLRAEHATGLVDVVGRHHGLIAATAEGAELADLLPAAAADAGLSCWALSATGRLVAGTSPLAEELRTRLARSFLSAPRLPHVERVGKARYSLFSAGTQPGSRLRAWFLACDGDPAAWPDGQRRSVDGLITLLTLERAHVDRALHAERRLAGQLLQPLCAGGADPAEVRARLQSCRLAPDGTYVALTATLVTES